MAHHIDHGERVVPIFIDRAAPLTPEHAALVDRRLARSMSDAPRIIYDGPRGLTVLVTHKEPQGRDVADFIVLKRPGPPSREVLVNLDQILMVQPGQSSGSAILFGKDHLVNFEEDLPTVIRRIQTGPYVRTDHG